ncbi:zinc finger protein 135-like [Calliphora vicina]|uniref:zinc finger protein 135-like n=1 Tax=Calliphora vicina TaxID=7373 RepID=UPI00325B6D81
MQTIAQEMPNSVGYIKCGEILKSQKSFPDPYILRCIQCKEIYLLLESFIFHLDDTCKKTVEAKKNFKEQINECEVVNEPMGCEEEPPVKLENTNAQMEDPLIVIKNEADTEKSIIKIEPSHFDESKSLAFESSSYFDDTRYLDQDEEEYVEEGETSISSQEECESQNTEPEEVEVIQKPSNTNGVSSSFVSNFMKSEENVTVLIAAFKDQPQLWNKTMPYYGNKLKRREYMVEIAQDLHSNHNININGSQVSAVIVHLYRKYQDDLHRAQEKDESKRQMYVKPWYLTQLNFIKPYLENFSLEIIGVNQANLMPDQIVQILNIYRCLPHLWNSNLIENHCKNKRHESILEMLKQVETNMNIKINENELELYLRTIHNNFSREKRRILNNKKSSKSDNVDQPNNDYYECLMFLYDHVPPLKCSVCGGESISPLHFKIHTSTHDGSMPFSCSQCNKTFKRVNVYTSHAKRHFEDLNYICKECGKKFVNYTNLRLHMRIHTGDKPYCCEMCGDSFRFLQTLSNHRRRHEKRYLHTCKICSQGFYSKMRHDDHMNSHMNIRPHICDICNKAFITKRALKQHKVVHEDVRNYACKLCGKTFKHKTGVNQHMKTHDIATTDERSTI